MLENTRWLGHDSFLIDDVATGKRIYVDPYKLEGQPLPADLILVSHGHSDHFSPDDIARLRKPETVVVTVPAVARQLTGSIVRVHPGDSVVAAGITIEAVPAYNVNKFRSPGHPFHPKEAGGVGFILNVAGQRIYHAGDSDLIPEMEGLHVDVALLPVSGTYVMTAEEAAEAAALIRPKVAVPMHYSAIVGTAADAQRFAELAAARGVTVQILNRS